MSRNIFLNHIGSIYMPFASNAACKYFLHELLLRCIILRSTPNLGTTMLQYYIHCATKFLYIEIKFAISTFNVLISFKCYDTSFLIAF